VPRRLFLLIVEDEGEAVDVSVHSTREHAVNYLAEQCRGWWDELPQVEPGDDLPQAAEEAVSVFFEDALGWTYQLDEVPLDPEPQDAVEKAEED
jgi:hypothetical protein